KDSIIEAAHLSTTPGHEIAYVLAVAGVFVSALYSFRLVFFAFHGKERFNDPIPGQEHTEEEPHHHEMHGPPHETPWVGTRPTILERKYGFDEFNDWFFAGGARRVGEALWKWGDRNLIDGIMVNGTAKLIGWFAGVSRRLQTGYIYHYAFTMILGVFAMLTWFW